MIKLIFAETKTNKYSLAVLAGAVEKEMETEPALKDLEVSFIPEENLLKEALESIKKFKKVVVAYSFHTFNVPNLKKQIPKLRKRLPENVILIAGGPHASGAPEETLKMGFDFAIVGEGEEILIKFLKNLAHERHLGGETRLPARQVPRHLPARQRLRRQALAGGRDGRVDITKFPPISVKFNRFAPLEITRCCPFGCRFCQTTYLFGKIRHRTINQIINAAKAMRERGLGDVRFTTPNLFAYGSSDGRKPNLKALENLLATLRSTPGVKRIFAGSFPSEVRPEHVTPEALKILKKYADNDNIIVGAQSGSDRMLKLAHRGNTVEQAFEAIKTALDFGYKVNVDFIFGMPGETKEDEEQTIEFIKKIADLGARTHSHVFMPLPGTPWANEKPGKTSKRLRSVLGELSKTGLEYGDWQKQERFLSQT